MANPECLPLLREIEIELSKAEVQLLIRSASPIKQAEFISALSDLSLAIIRIENANLADIASKLGELEPEILIGIKNLKKKIEQLDSAISIINTVSKVLGLVARVIAFI